MRELPLQCGANHSVRAVLLEFGIKKPDRKDRVSW